MVFETRPSLHAERRHTDLKWSLTVRIILIAWLCFAAASAWAIYSAFQDASSMNRKTADAIAQLLEVQLFRISADLEPRTNFPDWSTLIDQVTTAGQCVRYLAPGGQLKRSDCLGMEASQSFLQDWYSALIAALVAETPEVRRALAFNGKAEGTVSVTMSPAALARRTWSEVSKLLGLTFATVVAMSTLVYSVIARALAPTQTILDGLDRLASGDLRCRLPEFDLIELHHIAHVFNGLASRLEHTRHENLLLARKLVDAQEQERLSIARELHDELAQNLSGMSAIAASIRAAAGTASPALAAEAALLSATLAKVMRAVRTTLTNLRPQELDDLGLEPSLRGLIASFEARRPGGPRVSLLVDGDLTLLSPTASGHVFRIVQEALTNIGKHASANEARVCLAFLPRSAVDAEPERLEILIEDDGVGSSSAQPADEARFGLVGMRERALALGGEISARADPEAGFRIRVVIPIDRSGVR